MALSGAYASALGNLRDTVKWITAAFTGAGAIIFSGLAVTNIAQLTERGHWILPVALAAVPLLAAACVIVAALQVITVTPPPPHDLFPGYWQALTGDAQSPPQPQVSLGQELPTAVAVYGSLQNFDARLVVALDTVRRSERLLDGTAERQVDHEAALALVDGLQPTVQDALDCAAYVTARQKYKTAVWQILAAAAVAVAGLLASGIVSGYLVRTQQVEKATVAKAAPPVPVSFRVPTAVSVLFTSGLPTHSGGPHACPLWNGISALAVGGTFVHPLLLFSGYSAADARSNGVTKSSRQCHKPWLWSTKPGQVLLVPK
jgi:hypothetical protein